MNLFFTLVFAVVSILSISCGKDNVTGPSPIPQTSPPGTSPVTPPPISIGSQPPVVLYIAGDIANCDPDHPNVLNGRFGHEYVADLLSTLGLDAQSRLFLAAGDLAYFQGSKVQFETCYDPSLGKFKPSTRSAPGNHEYEAKPGNDYYEYMGVVAAGPPGLGYFSFDPPGDHWHVISGNSNLNPLAVDTPAYLAYLAWLENDLKMSSRPCTLFFDHFPRFSSGIGGENPEVFKEFAILYKYKVEIMASGHDHDYERFAPQDPSGRLDPENGIVQIVSGTGGAELRGFTGTKQNSMNKDEHSWGVTQFTLGPGNYQLQFLPATGSFTDTYSGTCH